MSSGKIIKDLPPVPGNPRNSEGAFIALKNGDLMFVYSRFEGTRGDDHAHANIAKMISRDQGETFSEPETLLTADSMRAMNLMSVSMMRMNDGSIGLFYLNRQSWFDLRMELRVSKDEGQTFGEPVSCMGRPAYFVVNNDRLIRAKSGRIIIPASQHAVLTDERGEVRHFGAGIVTFFYSDDDGKTWNESDHPVALPSSDNMGLQEPGALELNNGLLWVWARTTRGSQYEFYSMNEGVTFTPPTASRFTSPLSPMTVRRLSDGRLIAVWNPVPDYVTREYRGSGRTPLIYELSEDDGKNWSKPVVLEDDPESGYCYTAIYEHKGSLFLGYCAGNDRTDGACLFRARIRKIAVSEL